MSHVQSLFLSYVIVQYMSCFVNVVCQISFFILYVYIYIIIYLFIYLFIQTHTHIYIYIFRHIYIYITFHIIVSFICHTSPRFIPQLITLSYQSRELHWFRAQLPGHEEESDLGGRHDHEDHGEGRSQDRGALGEAPHSQVGHFDHHPTLVRERINKLYTGNRPHVGGSGKSMQQIKKIQWQWNSNRSG